MGLNEQPPGKLDLRKRRVRHIEVKDATNPKYEGESNTLKQPRDWELATTDNPVPDTLITSLLCNFATSTGISASRIIDSCHYGNVTYCRSLP